MQELPETAAYERAFILEREKLRPWRHIGLLLLTLVTATIAGSLYPFGPLMIFPEADPKGWKEVFEFLIAAPASYISLLVSAVGYLTSDWANLARALSFSGSLLFILVAHEMGHYVACRIYRVDATLPYFIPTPPLIGPAGTFGAFIKIVSPMPSRRAIFDIGVAGPIAGFIALIPVALIAFFTFQPAPPQSSPEIPGGTLIFANSLFFKFLALIFGTDLNTQMSPNPFYFAAWVGLLVTALNLIPTGQLDGGHAIFAVFSSRFHRLTGRVAFVVVVILSVSGWFLYNSPSGFLFAVLLFFMMRVGHPSPIDDTPLDFKRKIIAILTLLIFILSFTPFPIQIK